MQKPKIICLTPVKNEAAILDRFLKCASVWADHIIIADQSSTDGTREIASRYPKVILTHNPSPKFDCGKMREVLFNEARRIPGKRLLIALDADEMLSANALESPEWQTILKAPAGTVIRFRQIVLQQDLSTYWEPSIDFQWGFMDDGSEYSSSEIHELRIPLTPGAPIITLRDIKVLAYPEDMEKLKSKQRWYLCWERLNRPNLSIVDTYRQYFRAEHIPPEQIKSVPAKWIKGYQEKGIDISNCLREPILRWDREVLEFFDEHGCRKFRKLPIWDVDWNALSDKIHPDRKNPSYKDPRSFLDKTIQEWLKNTQHHYTYFNKKKPKLSIRITQKIIRLMGW